MCTTWYPWSSEEGGHQITENVSYGCWKCLGGFWELNPGPPQEVFVTIELFLQPT